MYRIAALLVALILTPLPAHAHGGGIDLHIFSESTVINNLVWAALLAVVAIFGLFALNRFAEDRVRQAVRAAKQAGRRAG